MTARPLIALFLLSSAFVSLNLSPDEALAMGGISGGGGNVLPGKAPDSYQDPEVVEDQVRESRTLVFEYLSQQSDERSSAILEAARQVPLHIKDDSPCFDAAGNIVDGSVAGIAQPERDFGFGPRRHGRVCISALNIARKVHASELRAQAAALLIHEYAELTGSNEDQAVMLQTEAFKSLQR